VLSIERGRGKALSEMELEALFEEWYSASLPNLRPDQSRAAYLDEFLEASDSAECGLDESALLIAWEKAKNSPPHYAAADFKSPRIRKLIGLTWYLQLHAGENPFYLSCRSAAVFLEVSHVRAGQFLRLLVRKKILRIVERGGPETNRATRFKFVLIQKPKGETL
jgi:hypothetical protein